MATLLHRHITAADLDDLPHEWDTVYELIGGELHMSRKPSLRHQETILRLVLALAPSVLRQGGAVFQEVGLVWEERGKDNVSPDLGIVLKRPPADQAKLRICPEICVEVLSPGKENRERDLVAKRALYWRRGAKEYLIVDPETKTVLRLTRGRVDWLDVELSGGDRLKTPLLKRWKGVKVASLFSA